MQLHLVFFESVIEDIFEVSDDVGGEGELAVVCGLVDLLIGYQALVVVVPGDEGFSLMVVFFGVGLHFCLSEYAEVN